MQELEEELQPFYAKQIKSRKNRDFRAANMSDSALSMSLKERKQSLWVLVVRESFLEEEASSNEVLRDAQDLKRWKGEAVGL